eukprot:scaffold101400_cov30-Tisochrysis_lutea.AAC.6
MHASRPPGRSLPVRIGGWSLRERREGSNTRRAGKRRVHSLSPTSSLVSPMPHHCISSGPDGVHPLGTLLRAQIDRLWLDRQDACAMSGARGAANVPDPG